MKAGDLVIMKDEARLYYRKRPATKWIRNRIKLVVIEVAEEVATVKVARPRMANGRFQTPALRVRTKLLEPTEFRKMGPRPGNRRGGWPKEFKWPY